MALPTLQLQRSFRRARSAFLPSAALFVLSGCYTQVTPPPSTSLSPADSNETVVVRHEYYYCPAHGYRCDHHHDCWHDATCEHWWIATQWSYVTWLPVGCREPRAYRPVYSHRPSSWDGHYGRPSYDRPPHGRPAAPPQSDEKADRRRGLREKVVSLFNSGDAGRSSETPDGGSSGESKAGSNDGGSGSQPSQPAPKPSAKGERRRGL